jgi:ElaB/YqjD/DUF883 family membrane-anchored ribosome-binding protein
MNNENFQSIDKTSGNDDVSTSVSNLISCAEELLRTTASYSGAEIEAARARLKIQLEGARNRIDAYQDSLREPYRRVTEATDTFVHENAWKTIGMAAVLGILAGKCIGASEPVRRAMPLWRR